MKTRVTLNRQERLDVLTNAIENNGIQYWACDHGQILIDRDKDLNITRAEFDAGDENGNKKHFVITAKDIQRGVDKVFSEGFQVAEWIKKQIVTNDNDVNTDDAIIQAACFGKLVYG